MKTVVLFPGQGSQKPGMALDLYEKHASVRHIFQAASVLWKRDVKKTIAESDADSLKATNVAQVCLTVADLAYWTDFCERGEAAASVVAVAGHSLGEYPALCAAGLISVEECLVLVAARGEAMHNAVTQITEASGMAAVLGLPVQKVCQVCDDLRAGGAEVWAANMNSPRQTVIAGTKAALAAAEAAFKAAGAKRVAPLPVAGPFHTPLMEKAAHDFAAALDLVPFADPKIPFFSNVTGKRVETGTEAHDLSRIQMISGVRWTEIEANIATLCGDDALCGADTTIEMFEAGPGTVLTGLWEQK